MTVDSAIPAESSPSPRQRLLRRALLVALGVVPLAVLVAPTIIGATPLRNALLSLAFRNIRGSVSAESASLGWLRPIVFEGIEIRSESGDPVIQVASLHGNTALWRILLLRDDLGNFVIDRPYARIVVSPGDSNFKEVFSQPEPELDQPEEPTNLQGIPKVNVSLRIADASISLQRVDGDPSAAIADDPSRWNATGINLAAGIRRSATNPEQAMLFIEQGTLIPRAEINRDVAHAWLKYVAPIVAESTSTEGAFSVDLDDWQIPLDAPEHGTGGGRLAIHSLHVTPGPIGQAIAELLKLPPSVVASQESVVQFQLQGGRVHHKDLHFTLGGLPVTTYGWVALDQTLEIVAEVTLPEFQNEEAPVRRALSGRVLKIPLRGTLAKPEVDGQALARSGVGILNEVLSNLGDRLGTQLPQIAPPTETGPPGDSAAPGEVSTTAPAAFDWQQTIESTIPLVQEALRNRRERLRTQVEERQAEGAPPLAPQNAMPQQFPERPLRGRVRRLLQGLGPPVENPSPTEKSPPAAAESPSELR